MKRVLHIEGIPGSGKTTAAEAVCQRLLEQGIDAYWALEEAADHPVMPKELRRRSSQDEFPQICLNAWSGFLDDLSQTAVLDGYAFQSTVRFMFANAVGDNKIIDYFKAWEQRGGDISQLVYFQVSDPIAHYETALPEKGDDWVHKVSVYVERTPYGLSRNLRGRDGLTEFWARYQDLCLNLIRGASIPVVTVPARSIDWHSSDANEVLEGFIVGRGVIPPLVANSL